MEQNKVQISLLILFTALFTVFNVGLPVVVHYCEMMKTTGNLDCGMCHTGRSNQNSLEISWGGSSCCQTIIVADRNKTEFLQTQTNGLTTLQYSITPIIQLFYLDELISLTKFISLTLHSPPLFEDIPIFTSSLLI